MLNCGSSNRCTSGVVAARALEHAVGLRALGSAAPGTTGDSGCASRSRSRVAHAVDVLPGDQHAARVGTLLPVISSNSVVLPEPFGPITPTIAGRVERSPPRSENVGVRAATAACGSRLRNGSTCEAGRLMAIAHAPEQPRALRGVVAQLGAPGPDATTVPRSSTYDAVGDLERARTFCSTSSTPTPSLFSRCIVRITSCTTFGARPWLGSSNSTRPGRAEQRARDRDHLHLAAGQVLALALHQILERAERSRSTRSRVQRAKRGASCARSTRLRATVSVGKMRRSSGTQPTPRARDLVRAARA